MNKGLEALKKIKKVACGYEGLAYLEEIYEEEVDVIEKELKEHEKDKKMLEIFKNALTIEHHEIPLELINSSDIHEFISGITKQITTIKENELDKKLRKSLREWVLKNAFPKELKALEIIKKKRVDIVGVLIYAFEEDNGCEFYNSYISNEENKITQEEYDLLKEMLL